MYTADTGRAGGAQINVVTSSGTSKFHGSLYEFFRNNTLAANNWINNANSVNVVNGKAQVPPIRWNDFGGTIGGPVPLGHYNKDKNKTFFFFSEEARRIHTYTTLQPGAAHARRCSRATFTTPVCISQLPAAARRVPRLPARSRPALINPVAAAYIKDICEQAAAGAARLPAAFFRCRTSTTAARK